MRNEESGNARRSGTSRVESYTDLTVWQKAMDLADAIYEISASFPTAETYGLSSQIRRAGVSIPSNIAEGWGRGHTNEYLQFLRYSRGSLYEVGTQLRIPSRRCHVERAKVLELPEAADEISRMLADLTSALRRS